MSCVTHGDGQLHMGFLQLHRQVRGREAITAQGSIGEVAAFAAKCLALHWLVPVLAAFQEPAVW